MADDPTDNSPQSDHDSPWKEALVGWFPEFLALLFPDVHAGIDWSRGHAFLDKELQQIVRDAETGRRYTDKLVAVHRLDGKPAWVLVHVEVQGEAEAVFPARMFVYNHRLRDTYGVPVASLAVLADTDAGFRPERYTDELWGCAIDFRFPITKLLDWSSAERWAALEASDNVFALVVMAQIRAKASRDAETLKAWKFRLIRLMYDRGYARKTILELFRIIDWMIRLPTAVEAAFRRDLYAFEESKHMPYLTTVERAGIEKGLKQGLEQGLERGLAQGLAQGKQIGYREGEADLLLRLIGMKFGAEAVDTARQRIDAADSDTLRRWSERILTADSLEAIFG
jgi:hypothetical protein